MSEERIAEISKFVRPAIFAFVLLLHAAAIVFINFSSREENPKADEFVEAEVFKLVDIQEYTPPPPAPVEKSVVKVASQPKAAENIIETKEEVMEEKPAAQQTEIEYLPQHKISSIPVIPSREVLSRIVYPSMALKQGIEAVVYLELFIDSTGLIKKIKVLKDPGHGFAEAAVKALEGLKCIPASANGKNCAVKYRYPVKFTLN